MSKKGKSEIHNLGFRIQTEHTDEELRLIGLATVLWSEIEHDLFLATHELCERLSIDPPSDVESLIFEKRLKVFRNLADNFEPDERDRIVHLSDTITNIKDSRHKIIHGLWNWDRANPEKLIVYSFRPKVEFDRPFDVKKLNELNDRMNDVICQLKFPNGFSDFQIVPGESRFPGEPVKIDLETLEKWNEKPNK